MGPAGRQIAFKDDEGIWIVSPEGGDPKPLVRYGTPDKPKAEVLQWSRDGRTLFYKAFDDPLRQSTRPEFATDGRRFFFTIATRVSDVWEMALDRR